MEPKRNKNHQKFKVNLKKLPPLDPSTIYPTYYQDKYENTSSRNEDGFARRSSKKERSDMGDRQNMKVEEEEKGDASLSSCLTKSVDPNITMDLNFNRNNKNCHTQDASKRKSAKSKLLEICVANNWKLPSYDCCKEEGPPHIKLYTFKVVVEMRQDSTTLLECFGDPKTNKKMAAEHAAEGAVWYLSHIPNISKPAHWCGGSQH